jgi:glycosyltransferase involved in cell wall biosynthesis
MKIFFDNIVFELQKSGGISVYWSELISRLSKCTTHDVTFIISSKQINNIFFSCMKNISSVLFKYNIPYLSRYLPVKIGKYKSKFLFHSSYFRFSANHNAVNIATIYDCTYEIYGFGLSKFIHRFQKYLILRNADIIICISNNTKNDIIRFYPWVDIKKLRVIYLAASENFYPVDNFNLSKVDQRLLKNKYIIFVGSRKSYKNFNLVLEALYNLKEFNLLIVGGGSLNYFELRKIKKFEDRIIHIASPDQILLNALYGNAFCLVYPSIYEGFGIPILEAMKAGCPVICSGTASLGEVAGNACLFLDSISGANIASKIRKLEDSNLRDQFIKNGFIQASKFSWDKCYQETLKIYIEAYEKK